MPNLWEISGHIRRTRIAWCPCEYVCASSIAPYQWNFSRNENIWMDARECVGILCAIAVSFSRKIVACKFRIRISVRQYGFAYVFSVSVYLSRIFHIRCIRRGDSSHMQTPHGHLKLTLMKMTHLKSIQAGHVRTFIPIWSVKSCSPHLVQTNFCCCFFPEWAWRPWVVLLLYLWNTLSQMVQVSFSLCTDMWWSCRARTLTKWIGQKSHLCTRLPSGPKEL